MAKQDLPQTWWSAPTKSDNSQANYNQYVYETSYLWAIHNIVSFALHNNYVLLGLSILACKGGAENVQETSLISIPIPALIANVGYLCFTLLISSTISPYQILWSCHIESSVYSMVFLILVCGLLPITWQQQVSFRRSFQS